METYSGRLKGKLWIPRSNDNPPDDRMVPELLQYGRADHSWDKETINYLEDRMVIIELGFKTRVLNIPQMCGPLCAPACK